MQHKLNVYAASISMNKEKKSGKKVGSRALARRHGWGGERKERRKITKA